MFFHDIQNAPSRDAMTGKRRLSEMLDSQWRDAKPGRSQPSDVTFPGIHPDMISLAKTTPPLRLGNDAGIKRGAYRKHLIDDRLPQRQNPVETLRAGQFA